MFTTLPFFSVADTGSLLRTSSRFAKVKLLSLTKRHHYESASSPLSIVQIPIGLEQPHRNVAGEVLKS